jgi:hypothetical protein
VNKNEQPLDEMSNTERSPSAGVASAILKIIIFVRPVIMERPAQVTKSWVTLRAATPREQSHMERGAGRWERIHDLLG